MPENGRGNGADVIRGGMESALKDGSRLGCHDQTDAGSRSGAPIDHIIGKGGPISFARAGSSCQIDGEFINMICYRHFAHEILEGNDLFACDDLFCFELLACCCAFDDVDLL